MKVAIIGTGFGRSVMEPMFQSLGWETILVPARDSDGIKQVCANGVDLVSIHSPPFLHHDHVMWALDHKRNVNCDKPFGRNAAEARAMRDRARELGVLNFLNCEFRRKPARVKLHQLIGSGALGAVKHMNWTTFGNGFRSGRQTWVFDRDLGGGWIRSWGSHVVDQIRWLFDSEVADCGGLTRIDLPTRLDLEGAEHPSKAEDAFVAWLRMKSGATALIDSSWGAAAYAQPRVILSCKDALVELDARETTLTVKRAGQPDEVFEFTPRGGDPHEDMMIPWLTEVEQSIREERQISPSFEDGAAMVEALDRMHANSVHVEAPSLCPS